MSEYAVTEYYNSPRKTHFEKKPVHFLENQNKIDHNFLNKIHILGKNLRILT